MSGRILFIFTLKSLVYTVLAGLVGFVFYSIFSAIGLKIVGIAILVLFLVAGFVIGRFRVPEISSIAFTRKTGGENIDEIIKRGIKFKMQKNKIYVYSKEEKNNVIG